MFNAFSRKVEKHGYGTELPLFRLSIDNKIPYLGNFGYSPIYMFVKKDADNYITECFTLDPPQRNEQFVAKIAELSQLTGFQEKV